MFKSLHRVDRAAFWLWAVPIVFAHGLFAVAMVYNVHTPLGSVDTGLIVVLAIVLVGRFRDIGWPVWIGPAFLLGTMLVLPIVLLVYMISVGAAGSFLDAMMAVGQFSSVGNLALLVLAGSVPGRTPPPTTSEIPRYRVSAPLVFGVGVIAALLLVIAAALVGIFDTAKGPTTQAGATSTVTRSPIANTNAQPVLTKETNDFLKSLARTAPGLAK